MIPNLLNPGRTNTVNAGSGAVSSGSLAPNSVVSGTVASGAIMGQAGGGPFNIASGTVTTNDIGSGSINSGLLGSGQIGNFHVASGQIQGLGGAGVPNIASGTVNANNLVSGIPSRLMMDDSLTCEENISGVRAVNISQSGYLRVAMASVSGRMPACGIVVGNYLSGASSVPYYTFGAFQFTSGLNDYSGYNGAALYVGRSGNIVVNSGSWASGGYLSGDYQQVLGLVQNSGGIRANVTPIIEGPL